MSLATARVHLARFGRERDVIELPASSATVALAAQALGVEPERIAKTLSFYGAEPGSAILVVAAGDAKVASGAFKAEFGLKARMVGREDVEPLTGHQIGGVCPFANPTGARVYLDVSLRRFATAFPACGSGNSAIELTCDDLAAISGAAGWVDVCSGWRSDPPQASSAAGGAR